MIFSGRGVVMSMVVGMVVGMIVGMLLGHGSMFTLIPLSDFKMC